MISVAMTTYNGEEFIREQLESIRFQTIPAWKLQIRDDNYSDQIRAIIKEYEEKDSQFLI